MLKVKEPQASEYGFLRDDLTLFTYLHLAADQPLTDALLDAGTTAIAYETVRATDGTLPLLAPMSGIAGQLAVLAGVGYLQRPLGGRGLLPGSVPGISPSRVVIVGGGAVGYNAALIALGIGADVQLLDTSIARLRELKGLIPTADGQAEIPARAVLRGLRPLNAHAPWPLQRPKALSCRDFGQVDRRYRRHMPQPLQPRSEC